MPAELEIKAMPGGLRVNEQVRDGPGVPEVNNALGVFSVKDRIRYSFRFKASDDPIPVMVEPVRNERVLI